MGKIKHRSKRSRYSQTFTFFVIAICVITDSCKDCERMANMALSDGRDRKIVHISSFPPPIGGKSIFLQRLKYYTDLWEGNKIFYVDVSGINVKEKEKMGIYCTSKIGILPYLLKERPAHIVFHSNSALHLFLNLLLMHRHRFIYFAHGESILKEKNKKGWRHYILSKAECIVCPTENIYLEVKETFPDTVVKNISLVILPNNIRPLDECSLERLHQKADFVFSSYANTLVDYDGVSLYGIDMLIEGLYKLRKNGYNCGIVLLISDVTNKNKLQEYTTQITSLGLNDFFIILDQPMDEASRLYASTDAYLRPTNTDGNAFSIYEALSLGIPVVASDVVPRAKGCLIFQNRNVDDFVARMEFLMDNYDEIKESTQNLKIAGNEQKLVDFFRSIEKEYCEGDH